MTLPASGQLTLQEAIPNNDNLVVTAELGGQQATSRVHLYDVTAGVCQRDGVPDGTEGLGRALDAMSPGGPGVGQVLGTIWNAISIVRTGTSAAPAKEKTTMYGAKYTGSFRTIYSAGYEVSRNKDNSVVSSWEYYARDNDSVVKIYNATVSTTLGLSVWTCGVVA